MFHQNGSGRKNNEMKQKEHNHQKQALGGIKKFRKSKV
jgi:hypothetical protein